MESSANIYKQTEPDSIKINLLENKIDRLKEILKNSKNFVPLRKKEMKYVEFLLKEEDINLKETEFPQGPVSNIQASHPIVISL